MIAVELVEMFEVFAWILAPLPTGREAAIAKAEPLLPEAIRFVALVEIFEVLVAILAWLALPEAIIAVELVDMLEVFA